MVDSRLLLMGWAIWLGIPVGTMFAAHTSIATTKPIASPHVSSSPTAAKPIASPHASNSPTAAKPIAPSPSPAATMTPAASHPTAQGWPSWAWWLLIALLPILVVGGVLFQLRSKSARNPAPVPAAHENSGSSNGAVPPVSDELLQPAASAAIETTEQRQPAPAAIEAKDRAQQSGSALDTVATPTRLAKVDIVEELIGDLHSPDPGKRRKAIWELGQRGDSRALQPLVDLLVDADSQQRSLILAAVSEVGVRSLKPMNRALLMTVQDDSAEVRKNAIRDMTRLCDLVVQISQLLQYAASDSDSDVRETANWALGQLNRIRTAPGTEGLPGLVNGKGEAGNDSV